MDIIRAQQAASSDEGSTNIYDPAGLALKYGADGDVVEGLGSHLADSDSGSSSSSSSTTSRALGCPDDSTTGRFTGIMTTAALEELQRRNATLLKAVEEKNRQVLQLGTMVEALEPVPGLDPAAFLSVLRGGNECDYRDAKVVQLAKRARALNASLEGEKARCLKSRHETDVLARELESCRRKLELMSSAGARLAAEKSQRAAETSSSNTAGDRVIGNEAQRLRQQVVLLRNKLQEAQEEVRKSHRALSKEVGEGNEGFRQVFNDEGRWKGRAQQIIMLKARVKQLEAQLRSRGQGPGRMNGSRSAPCGQADVDSQAQEEINFIEDQRRRGIEQLEEKHRILQEEAKILRGQVMAKGARITGLEKVNAQIRDRVKMLQRKSDTDDQLIDALRSEIQALRGR